MNTMLRGILSIQHHHPTGVMGIRVSFCFTLRQAASVCGGCRADVNHLQTIFQQEGVHSLSDVLPNSVSLKWDDGIGRVLQGCRALCCWGSVQPEHQSHAQQQHTPHPKESGLWVMFWPEAQGLYLEYILNYSEFMLQWEHYCFCS